MTVQPLVDALDAALGAAGVAFGDGKRPDDATTRYVVAWFDAGRVENRSLRARDGLSFVGTFHCYGATPKAARVAYEALTAAVLGLRGTSVGGRVLLLPEQITTLPLQRDDDVNPPLYDAICEWRFRTTPA